MVVPALAGLTACSVGGRTTAKTPPTSHSTTAKASPVSGQGRPIGEVRRRS